MIVFDYDGVIYHEGSLRSLGVKLLKTALDEGYRVYIVSGRLRRDLSLLRGVLGEAGVEVGRLAGVFLRDKGSEVGFKLESYTRILDQEECILEIHDDNPEALWPARRMVSGGLVLHYNEECTAIYGLSVFDICRE